MKICSKSHVCKNADCRHKKPHEGQCANAMPCYDFEWKPGRIPDRCTVPVSACIPLTDDGKYYTFEYDSCPHCQGRGRTERKIEHSIPA